MEKIKNFLKVEIDYGIGCGIGCGNGSGEGNGYGFGDGSGEGIGYGNGDGSGYGIGNGVSYDEGYGYGNGIGYGCGDGCGDGIGYGSGSRDITYFDKYNVYQVDNVPTIITNVHRNIAKGFILNDDFTLTSCYIAKGQNQFAHGETIEQAVESLENKLFKTLNVDERISLFLKEFNDFGKKYPAKAFYDWHNKLTGSCEMGRNSFVKNGGYDLEKDTFTVQEFIDITKNAYGGSVIQKLEETIKNIKNEETYH